MTSLHNEPSVMGHEEQLSRPSFKACSSPELAITNKPVQDPVQQERTDKRARIDIRNNISGLADWEDRSFVPRRSDTIWSIFSQASTVTNTTEPDLQSPTTASSRAMNVPQYSSSPSVTESRSCSPAPLPSHDVGTHPRLHARLERPCRDQEKLIKQAHDPNRNMLKFGRIGSVGKQRMFHVGPPPDATPTEEPLVSQISAGLGAESAGDLKAIFPIRLKEESETREPVGEKFSNAQLPDLQGMQIDKDPNKNTKTDVTEEAALHETNTPTAANESSPEGLSPLIMTPGPDESDDMETSPSPIWDAGLIQDVCEQILRQAFGTEYDDIAHTDAAGEAYNAVSYCLDELSRILPDDSLFNSAICVQELPFGGSYTAPAQHEGSGSTSGTDRFNGGNNGSQKRPNDDGDGYPNRCPGDGSSPGDRDFGDGGNGGGNKRAKMAVESGGQGLSCPFRKRNPKKFNIRDHLYCAVRPLDDITLLKCKEDMQSREALDAHIQLPRDKICSPQEGPASRDPEDGITAQVENLLNNRKANAKIANWESLWGILFPSDAVVPKPDFEPPVERDEFYRDLQNARSQLTETLILNEELWRSGDQNLERQHVEQLVNIFDGHIKQVLQNSRRQSRNLVRRWRSGRRNPRAEILQAASPISPVAQTQGRRHDQLAVPRPIVKKRVINGDSNGNSLASSLETINSAESWANVGQAELMVTRSALSSAGLGNVQPRQGQVAQTGIGTSMIASPLSLRQGRQHDLLATPSPVTPRTPINPQGEFGTHGNGSIRLNQPAQVSDFHHNGQNLVDSGIEMVNHCPPVQGMNALTNIHGANSRAFFGPSPQPQQHRPAQMNFGGPLPQQVAAYQQQPEHMELAQPGLPQTVIREGYDFGWNWTNDEMNLQIALCCLRAQTNLRSFLLRQGRGGPEGELGHALIPAKVILEGRVGTEILPVHALVLQVFGVAGGLGSEDDAGVLGNGHGGAIGELDLARDEAIRGGCDARGGNGSSG
ncbi:hypothetical protein B0T20DRAFT_361272 [Sordaria brevicollis]|uniref:Uncharacterized protein n=1 Tax=Sordaria brevicollis TaxID=83679 RepID=A0AAE0P348_SORBR|nr:hypothetical protein B0T20DRAFT_361272 [Sordaria brevicollis]